MTQGPRWSLQYKRTSRSPDGQHRLAELGVADGKPHAVP